MFLDLLQYRSKTSKGVFDCNEYSILKRHWYLLFFLSLTPNSIKVQTTWKCRIYINKRSMMSQISTWQTKESIGSSLIIWGCLLAKSYLNMPICHYSNRLACNPNSPKASEITNQKPTSSEAEKASRAEWILILCANNVDSGPFWWTLSVSTSLRMARLSSVRC